MKKLFILGLRGGGAVVRSDNVLSLAAAFDLAWFNLGCGMATYLGKTTQTKLMEADFHHVPFHLVVSCYCPSLRVIPMKLKCDLCFYLYLC